MIEALISRQTPEIAERFVCETVARDDERWSYSREGDRIKLTGSNALCLAVAYAEFMTDCCGGRFSSEHELKYEEFRLPAEEVTGAMERKYRLCLSYEFFSCAGCWWGWERWEKEIDFMAMHGVNMPLAMVGTQAVWFKTMMESGMSEEFAMSEISGPSYWGWQLSNCFDAFLPQVKKETIEATVALGRKIIEREKELGMSPVMHAWSGYLSRLYIKSKLRARLLRTGSWFKFAQQYQVSAIDTHFNRIGVLYLKNMGLLLGDAEYYIADPFQAHPPAKSKEQFLAGYSTALYRCVTKHEPKAKLVMHSKSAYPAVIKAVGGDNLIVITDPEDSVEGTAQARRVSFNGCDVTALHGDMRAIASGESEGVSIESDGAYSNEILRLAAMRSLRGGFEIDPWLKKAVAQNRWRASSEKACQALDILLGTVWRKGQPSREGASLVCMRPTMQPSHTSLGDSGTQRAYDPSELFKAAALMLESGGSGHEFELDLADVVRQAVSDLAAPMCVSAIEAYIARDAAGFEKNSNRFLTAIEDLDRLMMTKKEFSLPYHLKAAGDSGSEKDESQNFEINLLAQITLFGPMRDNDLYDLCHKEWGDMLKTFYLKRWRSFFEILAVSFRKNRLSAKNKNRAYGRDDYLGTELGRKMADLEKDWVAHYSPDLEGMEKEETLAVARELMEKYG